MENEKEWKRYEDIINLPHHVSPHRPRMSITDRAAQFSPFAALTGFEDALIETDRRTNERVELEEDAKSALDERLRMIQEHIADHPKVSVTYFQPDGKKKGGLYVTVSGQVKGIDTYKKSVIMLDGTEIPVCEIMKIEGELFSF